MENKSTLVNAVVGAVVTTVLSFTGFSPIVGGAVAGYLQREPPKQGAKVGALSGLLAAVPFLLVLLLGGFLFFGGFAGRGFGVPGGLELVIVLFVLLPALFLWNVALGAAGGYLGASLRGERTETNERAVTR
ncbi:DUF5518 domain-containing protein [Halobium salinum]|uniref:DUF5518 domain-containing protein n=1 Tax=Halobium salinum TaxID=1364940 RepID=A0ABD5PB53_9EURY|nr:DUF5518 domain-containing protein [Halobium salinum]